MKVSEKVSALIELSLAGIVAEVAGLPLALAYGSVIWRAGSATYIHTAIRSI